MPANMGDAVEALKKKGTRLPVDIHDMRWHHVAAVFDGGVKAVYVDGKLDLAQMVWPRSAAAPAIGDWNVGSSPVEDVRYYLNSYVHSIWEGRGEEQGEFMGMIDELRIWNYTRPLSEIRKTMHVHISDDEEGLAYYNTFNGPDGMQSCGTPHGGPGDTGWERLRDDIKKGDVDRSRARTRSRRDLEGPEAAKVKAYWPNPVLVNAPVAGENGYAANLNGSNYFDLGNSVEDFNSTFSVELWFQARDMDTVMDFTTLVANRDPATSKSIHFSMDGMQYGLFFTPGEGLGWHVMNADGKVLSVSSNEYYNDGYWHQAVGTFDQYGVINLYIDGIHLGGLVMGDSHFVNPDSGATSFVGADGSGDMGTCFNGQIDEVSFWRHALTQPEVWGRYQAATLENPNVFGKLNHLPGKVAEFKFNEAYGTKVVSSIGDGTGTMVVAPQPSWSSLVSHPGFLPSTVPINRDLVLNATEEVCVPLYGGDVDGDVLEFYVMKPPAKGKLYYTTDCEEKLWEVVQAGITPVFIPSTVAVPFLTHVIYVMGDEAVSSDELYDSFTYSTSDGREFAAASEVPVRVVVQNTAPEAFDTEVETFENTPVEVLLNGIDYDGDMVAAYVGIPSLGYLGVNEYLPGTGNLVELDGAVDFPYLVQEDPDVRGLKFTFVPPKDINCPDAKFDFYLVDAQGAKSNVATVTVSIKPVNQPPVINGVFTKTLYLEKDILGPISVSDIDYWEADNGVLTVRLSAREGTLDRDPESTESPGTTSLGPFTGTEQEINRILSKIYYWRAPGSPVDEVLITVSDNFGNGAENGFAEETIVVTPVDPTGPIDDVRFSDSGLQIIVKLKDGALAVPFESCSSLFEASVVTTFGRKAECSLEGTVLVISLGSFPTVAPGEDLVFTAGVFGGSSVVTLQISNAMDGATPVVYLNVPENLDACDEVVFDGSSSDGGGGRELTYKWGFETLDPCPGCSDEEIAAQEELNCLLKAQANRANSSDGLSLDPELLGTGTYAISLTVTNFMGGVSETVTAVVRKAEAPVPKSRIDGRLELSQYSFQDLTIQGKGGASDCEARSEDTITYGWEFKLADSEEWTVTGVTGPFFYVPEPLSDLMPPVVDLDLSNAQTGELVYKKYEIRMVVTGCPAAGVEGECGVNYATATVTIIPSLIVAEVSGGSAGDWWSSAGYTVDASNSRDPDNLGVLQFEWSCTQSGSTSPCVDNTGSVLVPPSGTTSSTWTINRSEHELANGNYDFTVRVTSSGSSPDPRFGTAGTTTTITDEPIPLVKITTTTYVNGKHNPDKPLWLTVAGANGQQASSSDEITFLWTVTSAAVEDCSPSLRKECTIAGKDLDLLNPDVNWMRDEDGKTTVTGAFNPNLNEYGSLYLGPNTMTPGRYEFKVEASHIVEGRVWTSHVTYAVVVDSPPEPVGVMYALPDSGEALGTEFTFKTTGWSAEVPIRYEHGYVDSEGNFVPLTSSTQGTKAVLMLPSNLTEVATRACTPAGVCVVTTSPAPGVGGLKCVVEGCSFEPRILELAAAAREFAAAADYQNAICRIQILVEEINAAGAPVAGEAVERTNLRQQFSEIAISASGPGISEFKQVYVQKRNFYAPGEMNKNTRTDVVAWVKAKLDGMATEPAIGEQYADLISLILESASVSNYRRRLLELSADESDDILGLFDSLLTSTAKGVPANVPISYDTATAVIIGQQVLRSTLMLKTININGFAIPPNMTGIPADANTVIVQTKQFAGEELQPDSFFDPYAYIAAYQEPYPVKGKVASIAFQGLSTDMSVAPTDFGATWDSEERLVVKLPLGVSYNASVSEGLCALYTEDGGQARWSVTEEIVTAARDPEVGSTPTMVVCESTAAGAFAASDRIRPQSPPPPPTPTPPPPSPFPPPPLKDGKSWIERNWPYVLAGVLVGLFLICLILALLLMYKKKKVRMAKMIAAAESQEMLESQGLVDPMDGGMMPIKNPVAGAVRTTAILESDKV